MNAVRAAEIRDALAFMVAYTSGDTEGTAAIAGGAEPLALAGALACLIEGTLVWHGTNPAEWATTAQRGFLAAEPPL